MRIIPKVFILVLIAVCAVPMMLGASEQSLYQCNGIYQTMPCSAGVKGGKIENARQISRAGKLASASEEIVDQSAQEESVEESDMRARPDLEKLTSLPVRMEAPARPSFAELQGQVKILERELNQIVRSEGKVNTHVKITRVLGQVNAMCTEENYRDRVVKRNECDRLIRDVASLNRRTFTR